MSKKSPRGGEREDIERTTSVREEQDIKVL